MIKLNEKFGGLVKSIRELRRFGWIIMLLLGAALMISAIQAKEGKLIQNIITQVTPLAGGELLLTDEDVRFELERSFTKPLESIFLADVDVRRVESILEDHPLVADADAYVDADLNLHVKVVQRNPLLRVIANNGQNYLLDDQGVRMPLSESFTPRVLVATGNIVPWSNDYQAQDEHQLKDLYAMAQLLREDDFLHALIEQVYLNNDGEMVLAPKVGDQVIYLGRYHEQKTPERLIRLKVFYEKGLPYEGWRKYRSFDLRYADQVVCKKT
ncbi:MAG: hypothetical protein AAF828_01290 [Bacteroidota bacterium]